jgi:uncharacterized membrane protein YfcA
MLFRMGPRYADDQPFAPALHWMALAGLGTGFLSGLTGVGGGVFLAPLVIALAWTTPKGAAGLSAPFILVNSLLGLGGVVASGQRVASVYTPRPRSWVRSPGRPSACGSCPSRQRAASSRSSW